MAVSDTLFDKGGALYNVKASGYGVTGNGAGGSPTDDQAALNTLLNTTIPAAGGTAYFPTGTYYIGSDLTVPARVGVQFEAGAVIRVGAGMKLTISGPFEAPLAKVFDVSATGARATFTAGAVTEIRPEWWGTGTAAESTRAFRAAFAAAADAYNFTSSTRSIFVQPAVMLTPRHYQVNDELDYGAFCRLRAPGGAILEQTSANRRILMTSAGFTYDTTVEGVRFIGGTRHVEYLNHNRNATTLKLIDCTFDNSNDFSVWTLGSTGLEGDTVLGSLTSAVAVGNTVLHLSVPVPNQRLLFVGSHVKLGIELSGYYESAVTAVTWGTPSGGNIPADVTVATAATGAYASGTPVGLFALTTLASAPSPGSGTLVVNAGGTLGNLDGLHIALANPRGEVHSTAVTAVQSGAGTLTFTLLDAVPLHWTSADGAQPAAGALVRAGDLHLSSTVTIERCQFMNPRKAIHNTADSLVVRGDTWVQLGTNFYDDTAAVTNLSGDLHLDGFFGVPEVGDNSPGRTRRANVRWIDMAAAGYGLYVSDSRFGGEDAGIPVVDFRSPPAAEYPYIHTRVVIESSYVAAGGAFTGAGVLRLREHVPQLFVYRDCIGPAETPLIINGNGLGGDSVDLDTYFPANAPELYRLHLGPMLDFAAHGANLIPSQLRPFANLEDTRRFPVGPVYARLVSGATNQWMVTFQIPPYIAALQAFVSLSTDPNLPGSAAYRLTRSDVLELHTSWNGTAVTEYVGATPFVVPTPPAGSGHSAPTLVSVHFGTAGTGSATRAQDGNFRDVTLVYGNCTGYTTASLTLLHTGL